MKCSTILVVVKNPDRDLPAVKAGIEIVRNNSGSKLLIVYIIDGFIASGQVDAGKFPDEVRRSLLQKGEIFLESVKRDYASDLAIESILKVGIGRKLIKDVSKNLEPDLIVVGSEKANILQRISEQSLVEYMSLTLRIPTLVIPSDGS